MKKPVKVVRKAAHAKPAPKKVPPKKVTPKIKAARHAAALRAAKTRAANAKKAKLHPARQLSPGVAVACCSAEALAASLRLAGHPVSEQDVLALYWHTASDPDTGASIWATLEAAAQFGLAGVRPRFFRCLPVASGSKGTGGGFGGFAAATTADVVPAPGNLSLILGVDLPGSHTVLDTGSEWISWGEAWPVTAWPDVVIEEGWEVTWPDTR